MIWDPGRVSGSSQSFLIDGFPSHIRVLQAANDRYACARVVAAQPASGLTMHGSTVHIRDRLALTHLLDPLADPLPRSARHESRTPHAVQTGEPSLADEYEYVIHGKP